MNRRQWGRWLIWGLLGAAVLGVGVFLTLPTIVDRRMNTVEQAPPYVASERARALHERLFIADLHDDALLWSRDLLRRYSYGHSDLPRLVEGRVGLQVFATVTKTPKGMNFERNASDTDSITMLVMAQRWPVRTWDSLLERALYQSERLHAAQAGSEGRLRIVRTARDLSALLAEPPGKGLLGAVLASEGLQPLEGRLKNVDRLYDAGFRIMGLTHFFDNEVGGSAHGWDKGGLTPFGRQVVQRLQERRMIIDLAHASPALIDDVLAMTTRPVLVSHTGVKGTCPGPRNLSDEHLKAIARTGGVIGIAYFEGAVCDLSIAAIVKAIRHAADVAGVDHVALGSDYDGAIRVAIDTTGLVLLTQGLLEAGFSDDEVAAIMGGNVRRLLLQELPPG